LHSFVPQSRRMRYNEDMAGVDLYVRVHGLIRIISSGNENRARNLINTAWTTVPECPSVVGSSPNDFLFRHCVTLCYVHAQLISIQFDYRITWHKHIATSAYINFAKMFVVSARGCQSQEWWSLRTSPVDWWRKLIMTCRCTPCIKEITPQFRSDATGSECGVRNCATAYDLSTKPLQLYVLQFRKDIHEEWS